MTTHNTKDSNNTPQEQHLHQTSIHLSPTSYSSSSASPPPPFPFSPPFFQTSLPTSTAFALHSTLAHRTPGPSPISLDSISPTISTFDFSSSSSSWPNSISYHPSTPEPSSSSATSTLPVPTTPSSSFFPRRLSFQQPEQVHPLSLLKNPTMISTTTISHPPNLIMPSPMSSSSSSVPPSPLSDSASSYSLGNSQNQKSHPLLAARSLSTSHCPPMLARPRSQSSDPIPETTFMASSSSAACLLTPNNNLNPINAHLSSVAMNMSRRPSLPANHPLLHHHHPMERQRSYDPRRQPPGFYLQQQALLQEQFEHQQRVRRSQAQVTPAPVLLECQVVPLQRPALTPLPPSRSVSSLSSTSTLVSSLSSSSISSTLSSSTLTTFCTTVRHPLWLLDCKSCKTTLCEQAMLGHQTGDPDEKLFSTNLAVGVLGLPDRPVSIQCPCKFHNFACASCGSVCGYKLIQACAGCETDRGNGHFWIFYANEVVSHWRRIRRSNYASNSTSAITVISTSATKTATMEKEMAMSALVGKGALESSRPPLMTVSMPFEQDEDNALQVERQRWASGGIGEVDVVLAKSHLASAECEVDDEAEGRPMYWDDLLTWQSQTEGNVGR